MLRFATLATLFALAVSPPPFAQEIDAAYGSGGFATLGGYSSYYEDSNQLVVDAQGRTVATTYSGSAQAGTYVIFRKLADGSRDTSFNGGIVRINRGGPLELFSSLVPLPDGTVLGAGSFLRPELGYKYAPTLAVIPEDGENPDVWIYDDLVDSGARDILSLSDGSGYVALIARGDVSPRRCDLLFVTPDGTPNGSIGENGIVSLPFTDACTPIGLEPIGDGFAVAGRLSRDNGERATFLTRHRPTGAFNPRFGDDGILLNDDAPGTELSAGRFTSRDGVVLLTAGITRGSGAEAGLLTLKADRDGWVEAYGSSGVSVLWASENPFDLDATRLRFFPTTGEIDASGRVVLGNSVNGARLFRLTTEGVLDDSFGTGGVFDYTPSVNDANGNTYGGNVRLITLDGEDRVMVWGSFLRQDNSGGSFTGRITVQDAPPPPVSTLPAPWTSTDVGPVSVRGAASFVDGRFAITGAGDIWGNEDAFQFVHRRLSGDGSITVRLTDLDANWEWAKVGIMMRETLERGSKHAMLIATPELGVHAQNRAETLGATESNCDYQTHVPVWLRLVREGNDITALVSEDGAAWDVLEIVQLPMNETLYVGLVATSTDYQGRGDSATGTFSDVEFTETQFSGPLPEPWATDDIGPTVQGSAAFVDGSIRVEGGGDVWGNAGAFRFAWQEASGEATITARLTDLDAAHPWAKVGLMIRDDLTRESAHAMIVATPERGVHVQSRTPAAAYMSSTAAPEAFAAGAPVWLRLQRSGTVISASASGDGETWTHVTSLDIPMSESIHVGLMATATDYEGRRDTAVGFFDHVMIDGRAGLLAQPSPEAPALATPAFGIDSVHPNPSKGRTTVRLSIEIPGMYRVELIDLLGRTIARRDLREEVAGTQDVPFDLSGFTSGQYIVRVQDLTRGSHVLTRITLVR